MRALWKMATSVGFILFLSVPASAGTAFTAPSTAGNDQQLVCSVVNIGSTARQVTVRILDATGNDITLGGGCSVLIALHGGKLPAGYACAVGANGPAIGYCKVTVQGSQNQVRATICAFDIATGLCTGSAGAQ